MAPEFVALMSAPIPVVDPEDIKRIWDIEMPADVKYLAQLCSPGADALAVGMRSTLLKLWLKAGYLDAWREADGSPQNKVLEVAATCSVVPEDGHLRCDPEAILRALEE